VTTTIAEPTEKQPSFFGDVNRYFDKAAALLNYPQGLLDQIRHCQGRGEDQHHPIFRGAA
jgi:hypothetical protein